MAAGARIRAVVCPVLVAGAATAVFAPALRAFLHADDFCHCFDAMNRSLPGFAVQPWGGHVYLFRNALLWCLVHAFGMETRGYFTAILFAHALNVVLLHRVLRRYGAAPALACLAAAAWGTSPLLAGTLGWIAAL